MRDRPSGPELLWQARRVVLDHLLPQLPNDKRYDALMVAAAMATAAREGEAGDAPLRRALATLAEIDGGGADDARTPEQVAEALSARLTALAGAIRAGRHDADPATHTALLEITADRLAEANPKHLKARRGDA